MKTFRSLRALLGALSLLGGLCVALRVRSGRLQA